MNKFYNNLKTGLLLALLTSLILWIGAMLGGPEGMYFALIVAGIMNMVGLFFSHKIALMSVGAREVGPDSELYQIVAPLAQRANLPMPRVYVAPLAAPNAFATGRSPNNAAVCATEGLLRMLDREEVAGVMAHELAHVKHRDTLIQAVAATIGGAISMLAYNLMWFGGGGDDDDGGGNPLALIAVIILGPLAAVLIQAAISRSREFNADTAGGEICGNPIWLARALEKLHIGASRIPLPVNPAFNSLFIVEPLNPMRTMAILFQTHPPIEQRLQNLIGRETTGLFRTA